MVYSNFVFDYIPEQKIPKKKKKSFLFDFFIRKKILKYDFG